jgi:hypothetical protein
MVEGRRSDDMQTEALALDIALLKRQAEAFVAACDYYTSSEGSPQDKGTLAVAIIALCYEAADYQLKHLGSGGRYIPREG